MEAVADPWAPSLACLKVRWLVFLAFVEVKAVSLNRELAVVAPPEADLASLPCPASLKAVVPVPAST